MRVVLLAAGLGLTVFGARLYWIGEYAVNLPYWDQWTAAGLALFKPWVQGELKLIDLFAAHNEHRIFFTRVWDLSLFRLNSEQWDPVLHVVGNAALYGGFCSLLLLLCYRAGGAAFLWPAACGIFLLTATPYAYENLLWGFQSPFFFLSGFSWIAMAGMTLARPMHPLWLAGVAAGVCGLFAMGSGMAPPLAVGLSWILVHLRELGRGAFWREHGWTLGTVVVLTVAGYLLTPAVSHHQAIRIEGFWRWVEGVLRFLSWPYEDWRGLRYADTLFPWRALIVWLPFGAFLVQTVVSRSPGGQNPGRDVFLIAFGLWVLLQAGAMVISRGAAPNFGFSWRYHDLLGWSLLVNLLCGLQFLRQTNSRAWILAGSMCLCGWAVFLLWGFWILNSRVVESELPWWKVRQEAMLGHVDRYVQTGDRESLARAPWHERSYPSLEVLARLLDDPVVREFLPVSIREPIPLNPVGESGSAFVLNGIAETVPERSGERVWGNFSRETQTGAAGSIVLLLDRPSRHPLLTFYLAGRPDAPELRLAVISGGGRETVVERSHPGDRWLERRVALGNQGVRIHAESQFDGPWFGFSEPRELGYPGFVALWISRRPELFVVPGLILVFLGVDLRMVHSVVRRRIRMEPAEVS